MKINITYKRMREVNGVAVQFLIAKEFATVTPTNSIQYTDKPNTKLSAALKNVIKQVGKILPEYQDEADNISIKNALTDAKTGELLMGERGGYKFTPDNLIKTKNEIKELDKTEVELHVREVDSLEGLSEDDQETLSGIIVVKA